jgi:hypothetical protein
MTSADDSVPPMRWWLKDELARHWQMSLRKIDYMLERGEIRAKKIGNNVRIPDDERRRVEGAFPDWEPRRDRQSETIPSIGAETAASAE